MAGIKDGTAAEAVALEAQKRNQKAQADAKKKQETKKAPRP